MSIKIEPDNETIHALGQALGVIFANYLQARRAMIRFYDEGDRPITDLYFSQPDHEGRTRTIKDGLIIDDATGEIRGSCAIGPNAPSWLGEMLREAVENKK
jgi:hypothetical protein